MNWDEFADILGNLGRTENILIKELRSLLVNIYGKSTPKACFTLAHSLKGGTLKANLKT